MSLQSSFPSEFHNFLFLQNFLTYFSRSCGSNGWSQRFWDLSSEVSTFVTPFLNVPKRQVYRGALWLHYISFAYADIHSPLPCSPVEWKRSFFPRKLAGSCLHRANSLNKQFFPSVDPDLSTEHLTIVVHNCEPVYCHILMMSHLLRAHWNSKIGL